MWIRANTRILRGALALALVLWGTARLAGQDGSLDTSFQSPHYNLAVGLIAVEASSSVLCGYSPDGFRYSVARLTSQGAPDSSLNIGDGPESITPPIDFGSVVIPGSTNPAQINVLLPLANGQILAGGTFSHFNKVARRLLVRLNADGSVDTAFNPANGFEGNAVNRLAIGTGGKIYVGGQFTKVHGSSRNTGLVRLFADGSLDSSFVDSAIGFGAGVTGFSLQQDGKVLIDAAYANESFQPTLQVYRLGADGGLDAGFAQGAGTLAVPAKLRHGLMSNGQVLLSGGSGLYNGSLVNSNLFRLTKDGQVDSTFSGVTLRLSNVAGLISRILPAPDGRIYITGAFDTVEGLPRTGVARLLTDGRLDTSFVPEALVTGSPGAMALQPDGKILVGATVAVGGATRYVVSRLNAGGGAPPAKPRLGTLAVQPGGLITLGISDATGQVAIEASSDLANWGGLSTNSVEGGQLQCSDPAATAAKARFYRLRSIP